MSRALLLATVLSSFPHTALAQEAAADDTETRARENKEAEGGQKMTELPVITILATRQEADPLATPRSVSVIDSAATAGNVAASDHREGGRMIARHLIDLGHERVLLLAGPENSLVARERVGGMCELFRSAGIEPVLKHSDATFEAGTAFGRALDLHRFTACAAAYDALAVGFAVAARERGCAIPEDMSLTGFDDLMWAQIVSPSLTTIRQDLQAVADHALSFVAGETDASRIFPIDLVVRESTASPPAFPRKGGRHAE